MSICVDVHTPPTRFSGPRTTTTTTTIFMVPDCEPDFALDSAGGMKSKLVFSKYYEGTGYDKCFELYFYDDETSGRNFGNGSGGSVNLGLYQVQIVRYTDGVLKSSDVGDLPSITLGPDGNGGGSWTSASLTSAGVPYFTSNRRHCFCHRSSTVTKFLQDTCTDFPTEMGLADSAFNGDDQLRLILKSTGAIVDVIGLEGSTITVGGQSNAGSDHCLFRREIVGAAHRMNFLVG